MEALLKNLYQKKKKCFKKKRCSIEYFFNAIVTIIITNASVISSSSFSSPLLQTATKEKSHTSNLMIHSFHNHRDMSTYGCDIYIYCFYLR